MGAMKDFYLAREEWADSISELLNEPVEIQETDAPEIWTVALQDGIQVTKIDDVTYVDLHLSIECDTPEIVRKSIVTARQVMKHN